MRYGNFFCTPHFFPTTEPPSAPLSHLAFINHHTPVMLAHPLPIPVDCFWKLCISDWSDQVWNKKIFKFSFILTHLAVARSCEDYFLCGYGVDMRGSRKGHAMNTERKPVPYAASCICLFLNSPDYNRLNLQDFGCAEDDSETEALCEQLKDLSTESTKHIARNALREQRARFRDILQTVKVSGFWVRHPAKWVASGLDILQTVSGFWVRHPAEWLLG